MPKSRFLILFPVIAAVFLIITSSFFYGCSGNNGAGPKIKKGENEIPAGQETVKTRADNNAQDNTGTDKKTEPSKSESAPETDKNIKILFQITRDNLNSQKINGNECFSINLNSFLDGGIVNRDGSSIEILKLKDYPTSMVTSKKYNNYYYISSTINPVSEYSGFFFFNWDVDNQTLWESGFGKNNAEKIVDTNQAKFPGRVLCSPDNEYLIFLMTDKVKKDEKKEGWMSSRLNPFAKDTGLVIKNISSGEEKTVLEDTCNRQLCTSFCDFSNDGKYFYTISREQDKFEFVRITLKTGEVRRFTEIWPDFDWGSIDWDEFFPESGDMGYGSFSISPDETRLIGYKNYSSSNANHPCYVESSHNLWVFNIEENKTDKFEKQDGSVADSSWNRDSKEFALAISINSGCYPEYLDAKILKFDKDGKNSSELVFEPKSKLTNIEWSPVENIIAYDIYSTDLVGRIKLVNTDDKKITELINTEDDLKITADFQKPVLLLFADWVK